MKEDEEIKSLLSKFDNSPYDLFSTILSEHEFLPWKFTNAPFTWEDINNQIQFMTWVGKKLDFTKMEDWYSLTPNVQNLIFKCLIFSIQNF